MTSIIVGGGLGLVGSSATQANGLGVSGNAKIGQGNDLATVNATTGNLIIQGQDDFLSTVGIDDSLLRTYNSQGLFDGDNNDGWRQSLYRSLAINGNGTITRTAADGHQELFTSAGTGIWRSLEGEGGGAHDVLRTVSTPRVTGEAYEYEAGGSGVFEMYDSTGKLLGWRDDSGNLTTLTYTGTNVTGVTDASGQTVTLIYGTGSASKNLLSIQINAHTPGSSALATQTRVTYTYDASNRLSQVKVDLTPNNTADSVFFYTSYQYDGTSTRVTKITQSTDAAGTAVNSSLSISYVLQGGIYRVFTLTDAQNRTTQFHYDLTNGRTDVTDPMGNVTSYYYDPQGRLLGVESPDLGGGRRTLTSYQYDANSNITAVTDADGRAVHYAYDTDGNVKEIRDQMGNTVRRLYDADDRLLAETVFQTPAAANFGATEPANPLTTHYVYDSSERLAFVVTPEGRVTQYLYNALGQRISTLQYAGTLFTTASQYSASPAYPTATGFDLTSLQTWANSTADKSKVERVDTAYDPTGQVQSVTRYASVNPDGTGVATGSSVTRYVYDFEGHLLMQIDPRSTLTGNPYASAYGTGAAYVTSFAYDGLDRLIVAQDAVGRFTFTSYDDANNKVTTAQTNVLTTVETYNKSGDLVSRAVTGVNSGNLGTTQYYYDSNGWLRMSKDPTGAKTFYFWDALGRQVGVLSPEGELTETVYSDAGQKLRTIAYANRVSAAVMASLADGSGNPVLTADMYTVRGGTRPDVAPVVDLDTSAVGSGYRAAYSTSGASIAAVGGTLTVADPDNTTLVSAQVQLNGILNAGLEALSVDATTATNNGITQAYNSSTGVLTLTGNVSAANYQAVLRTLQYKNTGSPLKGGDRTIDVTVNDSRLNSNIATAVITVAGAPAPIVDLNGLGPGTTRTATLPILLGSPVLLTPNIILYDTTSNTIVSATVAIQTPLLTDAMAVTIPAGAGVTSSYNALTGTLSISGTASRDVYTQILRTLTLQSAAQLLDRMINVSFSNGTAAATSVLTITNSASSDASYPAAVAVPAVSGGGTAVTPILSSSSDRTAAWLYNRAGQLIYTINAAGYATGYQYDGAGQKIAQTQYATAVTVPASGRSEDLTITANASDRTTRFFYDGDRHLLATLDAAGYLTENTYDAAGQLIKTTAYANATPVAQRASGTLAVLRPSADLINDQLAYVLYDAQGRVAAQIDPAGYLTVYGYDVAGNRTGQVRCATAITYTGQSLSALQTAASVAGKDQYTFWSYDALNRVTQTLNYQGTLTTYAYNTTTGFLDSMTTASGTSDARITGYRYDDMGRVTNTLTGQGSASFLSGNANAWNTDGSGTAYGNKTLYDLAGRKIQTIDANGHVTYFYYDQDSRLVYTVDSAGEVSQTVYDAFGEVTSTIQFANRLASLSGLNGGLVPTATTGDAAFYAAVINPTTAAAFQSDSRNRIVQYGYTDKRGLLTQKVDGRGFAVANAYDAFGELILRATDVGDAPYQAVRFDQFTYDARGSQTSSAIDVQGANRVQKAVYDAFGRVVQAQDANGNTTLTAYDRLGRVTTVTDPFNKTTVSSYDAFGRVVTLTDRNGNTTSYTYADSTQTMTTTTPEGVVTTVVTNRYGQKITVTTGSAADASLSSTTYAYDKDGNLLTTVVDQGATGHLNLTTSNTYDNADVLKTVTDANGTQTTYQYDAVNRVLSRTVDPTGLNLKTQYVYSAFGQAYQVIDANNITTETVFDNKGESTAVIVDAVDQPGQPGSALKLATVYTYSALGLSRAVQEGVQASGSTNSWSFGAPLKTTTYIYDNNGQRISQIVDPAGLAITTTYAYDDNGNMVRKVDANLNVWRYVYDANNRQVYAIDPLGDVTETRYDGEGHAIKTIQYATPIAVSLFGSALSDPPSVIDVQTALAGTPAYSNDFSTNLNGLTVTNNSLSQIVLQNGQLALSTKANGTKIQPTVTGADYSLSSTPTIFRSEINTGTSSNGAGRNLFVAIGDANGYSYGVLFSGTQATVIYYTAATGFAAGPSMTVQDSTTYTLEMAVTSTGISFAMFAKGTGPTSGLTHQLAVSWTSAHYLVQTVAQPGQVAQTTYLDNLGVWQTTAPGASDRSTRNVYDRDGRLVYTLDALGDVTGYVYDQANRVIDTVRYAQPIDLTTVPDAPAKGDITSKLNLSDANNQHRRSVYDAAGRVIYSIDALNDVMQYAYDANGNIVAKSSYVTPLSGSVQYTQAWIATHLVISASADQITRSVYDAAGRLIYSVDALNDVTQYAYDANGNVVTKASYATPLSGSVQYTKAWISAHLVTSASTDQITRSVYDAAGRLIYSVDALNGVTQYVYDANGNIIVKTAYAKPISGAIQYTKEWISTNLVSDSSNDRVTHQIYDAADRVVYSVDARNYVTQYAYDQIGQVVQKTQYNNVLSGTIQYTQSWVSQNQTLDSQNDQTTQTSYDATGRIATITDAKGNKEYYSYDGLGNKKSYTNKNGSIWNYNYDAAGRMTDETTPKVNVTNVSTNSSNVPSATTTQTSLVTHIVYDAFGNVLERIENYGATDKTQARVTSYRYDALGRQVQTVNADTYVIGAATYGSQVAVYNATADAGANYIGRNETLTSLVSSVFYDAFGNATVSKDAGGSYSYKAYNLKGQLIYDTDSDGYVTQYGYDAFGNQTTLTRYANAINTSTQGATAYTVAQIQAVVLTNALDRTITTAYDQLNRKAAVVQSATYSYDSATRTSATASPTTMYQYNAFGDVTKQSQLQSVVGGVNNWISTYNYYDQVGNQTATIDAMGYLTQNQYNAFGKISDQKQWSDPLLSGYNVNGFSTPTPVSASAVNSTSSPIYLSSFTNGSTISPGLTGSIGATTSGNNFSQAGGGLVIQDTYSPSATTTMALVQSNAYVSYTSTTPANQQTTFTYDLSLNADTSGNGNTGGNINAKRLIGVGNWNGSSANASTFGLYLQLGRDSSGNNTVSLVQLDGTQTTTYQIAQYLKAGNPHIKIVVDARGATIYEYDDGVLPSNGFQYRADFSGGYLTNIAAQMFATSNARSTGTGEVQITVKSISIVSGTTSSISSDNLTSRQIANLRETKYSYDQLDRIISTTQVGVIKSSIVNGIVQSIIGDVVNSTSYDGVGNIISTIDPNGSVSLNFYDALGRLVNVVGAQHQIYQNPTMGNVSASTQTSALSSLTSYAYDALGNRVVTTQYAAGTTQSTPQTSLNVMPSSPAFNSGTDRRAYTFYNIMGQNTKSFDAIGNESDYSYNANGEEAKFEQDYLNYDNSVSHKVQIFSYNKRLLQIGEADLQESGSLAVHNIGYNAFGEVSKKYLTGGDQAYLDGSAGSPQEIYLYDNAGRLVYQKSSDGIPTVYFYDLLGRATSKVVSASLDLSAYIDSSNLNSSLSSINTLNASSIRRTDSTYDADGRVTQQSSPAFSESGPAISQRVAPGSQAYTYDPILSVGVGDNGTSTVLTYKGGAPLGAIVTISLARVGSTQFSTFTMVLDTTPLVGSPTDYNVPVFTLDITNLASGMGQYQFKISINGSANALLGESAAGVIQIQGPGMQGYTSAASQPFAYKVQTINQVPYYVFYQTATSGPSALAGLTAVDVCYSSYTGVIRYAVVDLGVDASGHKMYGVPVALTGVAIESFRPVLAGQNQFYAGSQAFASTGVSQGQATQSLISALSMGSLPLAQISNNYSIQSFQVKPVGQSSYQDVSIPVSGISPILLNTITDNDGYNHYLIASKFDYVLIVIDGNGVSRTFSGSYAPQATMFSRDDQAGGVGVQQYFSPTLTQKFDRWGNLLGSTDANGITTSYGYDEFNHMIRKSLPQVEAINDKGISYLASPTYLIAYDVDGRVIASIDANGNMSTQEFDNAGYMVGQVDGVGARKTFGYDAFGDLLVQRNPNNATTVFAYDQVGNLIGEYDPAKVLWTLYSYDALGRRVTDNRTLAVYKFDAWGNVLSEILPSYVDSNNVTHQQKITYKYDSMGNKIRQTDNNPGQPTNLGTTSQSGNVQAWTYDYYGRVQTNSGINGETTIYSYDYSGLETLESSLTIDSLYQYSVALQTVYSYYQNGLTKKIVHQYSPDGMAYREIDDTSFVYDVGGRLIYQKGNVAVGAGVLYTPDYVPGQDTWFTYDAAGRLSSADDRMANITYKYDLQGNRKSISVDYIDDLQVINGKTTSGSYYSNQISAGEIYQYDYDQDNRVVIEREAQTSKSGGSTTLSQRKGTYLVYDAAGNRVIERDYAVSGSVTVSAANVPSQLIQTTSAPDASGQTGAITQIITNGYDADNRLTYTQNLSGFASTTGSVVKRVYNDLDQVVYYDTYNYSGTSLKNRQTYTYNNDGTLARMQNSQVTSSQPANEIYTYDNAGNLTKLDLGSVGLYQYKYKVGKSSYLQTEIDASKQGATSTTIQQYDYLDRMVKAVTSNYDTSGYFTGSTYYTITVNGSGQIIKKAEDAGQPNIVVGKTLTADYLIYYGDQELGSFEAIHKVTAYDGFQGIYTTQNSSTANFGFNFDPISAEYPGLTPSTYVVQPNDTLQSIAQAAYGDSSLWYLIADANSIRDNDSLSVGTVLRLPNTVIAAHDNSDTYKAYNPQKIIGDISPQIPQPPPPEKSCNALATILIVVVAIVVTYFTAGAASSAMYAALGSTTGAAGVSAGAAAAVSVGSAAVGAAAGSVASQGVAIGLGEQKGFSWSAVGSAAIGGAVTGGLGAIPALQGDGFAAFARAVATNVSSQGIGVAFGTQHSFSWSAVAAAAVGGAVDGVLGSSDPAAKGLTNTPHEFSFDKLAVDTGRQFIRGVASQSVQIALERGGKLSLSSIAADAFGNALGNSIVGALQPKPQMQKPSAPAADAGASEGKIGSLRYNGPTLGSDFMDGLQAAFNEFDRSVAELDAYTSSPQVHTVQSGESLSTILGTSDPAAIGAFMRANDLTSSTIRPGDQLVLPSGDYSRADAAVGQVALDADNARLAALRQPTPISTGFYGSLDMPAYSGPYASSGYSESFPALATNVNSTADNTTFGSAVRDTGRALFNAGIDVVEGVPNLLSGALPGFPDYVPFLQDARLPYDTPGFGTAVEVLSGFGVVKALSAFGAAESAATNKIIQIETRSAATVNDVMVAAGNQPAWSASTDVLTQIVPRGTQYQMVMSEGQAQAVMEGKSWFGGWATPDAVPSQAFAREKLSILPEFKPDVSYVATVETTAPQTVNSGFAGPLGPYGGTGAQVEFVGGKNLKLVGSPRPLPQE